MSSPAAPARSAVETLLRRDRAVTLTGLVVVAGLAWAYMFHFAAEMDGMAMGAEMAMPRMESWGLVDLTLLFVMWAVMMVAMMLPSAAPMILLLAKVKRQRRAQHSPYFDTAAFVLGYLLVWTGFSAVATLAQWGLHSAALLSPMMASTNRYFGSGLLIAAGIFQWTPLKRACLVHCRSPLHFFMAEWRDGALGALQMGVHHGAYCVGCCWILMALLFVAGVMNLLWVATISIFVLIEKVVPRGELVGRISGAALAAAGLWIAAGIFAP